ncbi:MAG TPA: alpha/beta hydrolase [Spirochaeta sp.]|nr:alpha/beta hydrolase [Spirochaeta sp.]
MITKVNGVEIAYNILNPDGSEGWIILLNGVMASYSSWNHLSNILSKKGYRVLLHDLRGQLLSEKPAGPYSWKDHVEDLKGLMDELKIDKAHLIGTSYGGELAMCFVLDYPLLAETITVIDSVSHIEPLLGSAVDAWIASAQQGDPAAFFRIIAPTIYGESFIKQNSEFLAERARNMETLTPDYLEGQIELYKTFKTLNITNRLNEIKAPTLVVCGSEDRLKPPNYSGIIAEEISKSHYILIPGSGHVAIFEKPEELAIIILGFLARQQQPG